VPATQVIARDRHAEYLWACAAVGATLELIAVELRHLQRTEVREVQEGFKVGQKGSSAMPHKRNPISSRRSAGCRACCAAISRRASRTSPCGTSATSRTARSSGSCCPTRRCWPTT
jgi:adenylosuccinate lyase